MSRLKLPFRLNCEGYFIDGEGNILAKYMPGGWVCFPGGGVDGGETPRSAVVRETHEETGAVVEVKKGYGVLNFVWDENWAKTEKQKRRYQQYQGEEMHFFSGIIEKFNEIVEKDEDYWEGDKLQPIDKVIEAIRKNKESERLIEYRNSQIKFLESLR